MNLIHIFIFFSSFANACDTDQMQKLEISSIQ